MELRLRYHNLLSRRDSVSDERASAGGDPVGKFLVPGFESAFDEPLLARLEVFAVLKGVVHRMYSILVFEEAKVDLFNVLYENCHLLATYFEILAICLVPAIYIRFNAHEVHRVKVDFDCLGIEAGKGNHARVKQQENDSTDR